MVPVEGWIQRCGAQRESIVLPVSLTILAGAGPDHRPLAGEGVQLHNPCEVVRRPLVAVGPGAAGCVGHEGESIGHGRDRPDEERHGYGHCGYAGNHCELVACESAAFVNNIMSTRSAGLVRQAQFKRNLIFFAGNFCTPDLQVQALMVPGVMPCSPRSAHPGSFRLTGLPPAYKELHDGFVTCERIMPGLTPGLTVYAPTRRWALNCSLPTGYCQRRSTPTSSTRGYAQTPVPRCGHPFRLTGI